MAERPIIPSTVHVNFLITNINTAITASIGYDFSTNPFVDPTPEQLVPQLTTLFSGIPMGLWDDSISMQGLSGFVDTAAGQRFVLNGNGGGTGNRVGPLEYAPPQVACLALKKTVFAGPRNRGRTFWPWVPEGHINDAGIISTDQAILLEGACDELAQGGAISGNGIIGFGNMVIRHDSGPIGPGVTEVSLYAPSQMVATQRRRLVRRPS